MGRFFQVDPYAAAYHDLSPYQYATNNPVNSDDPLGLSEKAKADPEDYYNYGGGQYSNLFEWFSWLFDGEDPFAGGGGGGGGGPDGGEDFLPEGVQVLPEATVVDKRIPVQPDPLPDPEVWYYVYQNKHALAYRQKTNTLYEINHPTVRGKVVDGKWSWLTGGPKSQVYVWRMNDKKSQSDFWDFKGGRPELTLAPVVVTNPAAAVAFFEANEGGEYPYHIVDNNCQNYVLDGLVEGEAQIELPLLFIGGWKSGPKPIILGQQ